NSVLIGKEKSNLKVYWYWVSFNPFLPLVTCLLKFELGLVPEPALKV
ncbi:unnamed protein product, partial [Allacma fusca]